MLKKNKVIKTSRGISDILFKEWEMLLSGEISNARAQASCSIASNILKTKQLELAQQRFGVLVNGKEIPVVSFED